MMQARIIRRYLAFIRACLWSDKPALIIALIITHQHERRETAAPDDVWDDCFGIFQRDLERAGRNRANGWNSARRTIFSLPKYLDREALRVPILTFAASPSRSLTETVTVTRASIVYAKRVSSNLTARLGKPEKNLDYLAILIALT